MPCMGFPFGKTGLTYVFTKKKKKTYVYNYIYHVFVLGVSIGSNRLIVDNLGRFGWQAAVLASLSITGSMLASLMVFHLFFKKGEKR